MRAKEQIDTAYYYRSKSQLLLLLEVGVERFITNIEPLLISLTLLISLSPLLILHSPKKLKKIRKK